MNRELNFAGPSPLLYLIATPIGNLQEMSPRALEVCSSCDYLAAEDTRNSGKLMSLFGISKPWISCHEHNEEEASSKIVALLKEGKKVAYMSDAGYPTFSDPGERLVANCLANGIKVSVVSGPNAAVNALACSGLPSDHFYFEGFLPAKSSERTRELKELSSRKETIVFYESPHRIGDTLKAMFEVLGDRRAVIARELTKAHEEFVRGGLKELSELDPKTLIGEMVIVVEGGSSSNQEEEFDVKEELRKAIGNGLKGKDAIAYVVEKTKLPKKTVYNAYLEIK